jgi:hypothetical protein
LRATRWLQAFLTPGCHVFSLSIPIPIQGALGGLHPRRHRPHTPRLPGAAANPDALQRQAIYRYLHHQPDSHQPGVSPCTTSFFRCYRAWLGLAIRARLLAHHRLAVRAASAFGDGLRPDQAAVFADSPNDPVAATSPINYTQIWRSHLLFVSVRCVMGIPWQTSSDPGCG